MMYDPYSKNLRCKVFDIEATGLYYSHDRIISASFVDPDGTGLVQYFTEDPAAEDFTVSMILKELSDCDAVITYNGAGFDLPFVLSRAKKYGLAEKLPAMRSVDIYKLLKHYWQLAPSMESLRQKAVEDALGLAEYRTDLIGGGDCISLYSEYLNLGRSEAKDLILLHNADDVRQLARITQKLSFLPYHRIAFEQGMLMKAYTQSLLGQTEYRILTGPASLKGGKLSLSARIDPPCMPTAFYEDGFTLQAGADGKVQLDVYTGKAEGLEFADLRKLPVDAQSFSKLPGFSESFLVLSTENGINYAECMAVISALLEKLA